MNDRAGNELVIGDRVLALEPGRSSSWLSWAIVVEFTPKKVRVQFDGDKDTHLRSPSSVVKPMTEDCTYC